MSAPLGQAAQIAALNDAFRTAVGLSLIPGMIALTDGIASLPDQQQQDILQAVANFDQFTEENDPYGEHDFGSVEISGSKIYWKFDYYAGRACIWGSEHPADPTRSYRVLTIMLASEY